MAGSDIQAKVNAGLARAGIRTGNSGAKLSGTINRTSGADESTYPPTPGSTTTYACTVVLTEYSARDRDGTQITSRDVKALIAPDAETDPRNGDTLTVSGRTYTIVHVDTVQPGAVALLYECQVRSADT